MDLGSFHFFKRFTYINVVLYSLRAFEGKRKLRDFYFNLCIIEVKVVCHHRRRLLILLYFTFIQAQTFFRGFAPFSLQVLCKKTATVFKVASITRIGQAV